MGREIQLQLSEEKVILEIMGKQSVRKVIQMPQESREEDKESGNAVRGRWLKNTLKENKVWYPSITYLVPSGICVRWCVLLPEMTASDLRAVLENHSQTLLPKMGSGYRLYYRMVPLGDKMRVGILGVPIDYIKNYGVISKQLGRLTFKIKDCTDQLGEWVSRQVKEEKFIFFYKEGAMLYGGIVEAGMCLMVQKMPLACVKENTKEWLAMATTLMYYERQNKASKVYVIKQDIADEGWIDGLEKFFLRQFDCPIDSVEKQNDGQAIMPSNWYVLKKTREKKSLYLPKGIKKQMRQIVFLGVISYSLSIGLTIGSLCNEKKQLEAHRQSEAYQKEWQAYEYNLEKAEQVAAYKMRQAASDKTKQFFLEQLEPIDQVEKAMPLLEWGMDGINKEVYGVMPINTLYDSVERIPMIEAYFPNQTLRYHYEDTNRWGKNQLTFHISEVKDDA